MQSDHRPTPAEIIGELLTSHSEAASLLRHASRCRALAVCSAVTTRIRLAAAQAARLTYEELRHQVGPRGRHLVYSGAGLLLAQRRWHRARTAYEKAVETERADAEAAAVAAEAWLGLVTTWVTAIAVSDKRLVQATMALAAVLMERSHPQLPPSL